jgi:hypothetical protein
MSINMGALLVFLSLQGIEVGSKPYWIVTLLVMAHGVICSWGRE